MTDRIRSRLAALRAERDAIDRAIAELAALLALEGVPEEPPEPPPEPTPGKPAAPPPGGGPSRSKDWPQLLRAALADGPRRIGDLCAGLRTTAFTLRPVLEDNPWFGRVDPGNRLSPWQLTAAGREATTPPPACSPPTTG